eukprot:scaffold255857_cov26-Attheya_sp.AAC.1
MGSMISASTMRMILLLLLWRSQAVVGIRMIGDGSWGGPSWASDSWPIILHGPLRVLLGPNQSSTTSTTTTSS